MTHSPETDAPFSGTPLVLMVNGEEWTARSLESILKPKGFAVLRAYTGRQGLDLASSASPDLLIIDMRLPDMKGIDLCERLRRLPSIPPATPIMLLGTEAVGRRTRIEAHRAGAWGVLHPPFSPSELLAQVTPYIAAKRHADTALQTTHIDPATGFYNMQGLMHRMAEIKADAMRNRRPLACVMVAPRQVEPELGEPAEDDGDRPSAWDITRVLAEILLSATRLSDAVGRVGENSFVIVAPGADDDGANHLAERVMQAVARSSDQHEVLRRAKVSVGIHAVSGAEAEPVIPEELLRRANQALQDAQTAEQSSRFGPSGLSRN